jgi:hypothetical protein
MSLKRKADEIVEDTSYRGSDKKKSFGDFITNAFTSVVSFFTGREKRQKVQFDQDIYTISVL